MSQDQSLVGANVVYPLIGLLPASGFEFNWLQYLSLPSGVPSQVSFSPDDLKLVLILSSPVGRFIIFNTADGTIRQSFSDNLNQIVGGALHGLL